MLGQNYHKMFVIDLLHKIEISVWKSVLMHLICMLYTSLGGASHVADLDARKVSYTAL